MVMRRIFLVAAAVLTSLGGKESSDKPNGNTYTQRKRVKERPVPVSSWERLYIHTTAQSFYEASVSSPLGCVGRRGAADARLVAGARLHDVCGVSVDKAEIGRPWRSTLAPLHGRPVGSPR